MSEEARKKLLAWAPTITFGVALYAILTRVENVIGLLSNIARIFNPLFIGASIALVMNVPLRGCEGIFQRCDRKGRVSEKMRHIISIIIVFLFTPAFIAAILYFFVPQFAAAISSLIELVTENSEEIVQFAKGFGISSDVVKARINDFTTWITTNLGNIAGITLSTVKSIVSSVTSGVMGIMLALYLLISKKQLCRQGTRVMYAVFPNKAAEFIMRVGLMFVEAFSRFLSRQVLEALILGVILFVSMAIFSIPYAVSICSLTVVLALIPYVGAILSMVIGALMILLVSPTKALIFLIIFIVVQQIEENLIYPYVVGESVGLPAYITLLAVAIGGEMMGMVGMLLFVPVVSVLYTLAREFVNRRVPAEVPLPDVTQHKKKRGKKK